MFIKFHNRKGFTLVELIIVLAILGILSAIALSRLNYQRQMAANRVCNSKMGEIKKAAEAYYVQYGDAITGAAGTIDGSDVLTSNNFLKGIPSNPHGTTGSYKVIVGDTVGTVVQETADVTCPGGASFGRPTSSPHP